MSVPTTFLRRFLLASTLVSVVPAVGAASAAQPSASPSTSLSGTESTIVNRTNEARARRGLPALVADASLMASARRQAEWMARNRSLTHGQGVTENIAMGQSSADQAVADWMRSDGHRANILGSHGRIGVAVAHAADGTAYWCQQFR